MARIKRATMKGAKERKRIMFITASRGAHSREESLALLTILRDMLKLTENAREARKVVKARMVKVDGKIVTDPKRGLGIFDVLEVGGKTYRVVPKKSLELTEAEAGQKITQIIGKTAVSGGKIQANLSDGKNIVLHKNAYKVLDSLLLTLPDQKVKEHIALEPGVTVLITKGKNRGRTAKLIDIERDNKRAWVEGDGHKFEAPLYGIVAVGKDAPLIELGE